MTPSLDGIATETPRSAGAVLVVDDDPVIREVVGAMLAGGHYRSMLAGTAAEAVALASDPAKGVAVALVDVQIPGVEGLDLFARLRAAAPAVALIAMTGIVDPDSVAAFAGVGVLPKPFTADQLLAAVAR
jgi:CheY-like chemotaxis protein